MVMLDWTAADLAAWEEEQRKKKEEEERAALGLTAPVYTSPTLAPAETYTPPPPPPPAPPPAPERDSWEVPESAAAGLSSVAEPPPPPPPGSLDAAGMAGPPAPEIIYNPNQPLDTTQVDDQRNAPPPPVQGGMMLGGLGLVDDNGNPIDPSIYQQFGFGAEGKPLNSASAAILSNPNFAPPRGPETQPIPTGMAPPAALADATSTVTALNWQTGEEQQTPKKPGGLAGILSDVVGAAGDVVGTVGNVPVSPLLGAIPGASLALTAANNLIPGKDVNTVGDVAGLYGTDVPVYSDFAREQLIPGAAAALNAQNPLTWFDNPAKNTVEGANRFGAENIVPVSAGDVATTLAPAVAKAATSPEVAARLSASGTLDSILGNADILRNPRANAAAARAAGYNPTQIARDVLQRGPEAGLTGIVGEDNLAELLQASIDARKAANATGGAATAAERLAKNADSAQLVQDATDKATMFQRVNHDTKTLRNRAQQVAERLEKLKAAAADETGAIRLPGAADNVVEELPGTQLSAPLNELPTTGEQIRFGEGFAPDKPSALQRFADNVTATPSALKSIQTSGDVFGFQFRQGAPSAFIDPKAWGKNFGRMYKAYIEDPAAKAAMEGLQAEPRFTTGELLTTATKSPVIDPKTGKQIVIKPMAEVMETFRTPGMERINENTLMSNIAENFPLSKRSEKSMRVGYLGLANDLRNSMIDDAIRAGVTDQSWYDHYDDIAKVTVGYGDVPEKLKTFSNGFYSLRNIAARFQMMTKPITEPGPLLDLRLPGSNRAGPLGGVFSASPRGVASRNLVRFAAGELANLRLLSYAGKASGGFDVGWNPLESGFGTLQGIDEDGNTFSTDLMGGWGSYIKMISRTAAAVNGDDRFDPFDEQVKFWRYKAGPVPSMVIDTIVANSDLKDLRGFDSPFAKPITDIDKWKPSDYASNFMPFFAGSAAAPVLDGVVDVRKPDDLLKIGGLLSAAWAGSPTSMYEPSSYSLAPQMFDGKQFQDLTGAERAQVNVKLLDQGGKLEGWQRVSPYDRADDDAFAKIKAANPELAKYKDLPSLRDDLERQIIAKAEQEGITLESQEVDTKRQALEKKLGIDKYTEPLHALVVATDPGIVAEMQKMYDSKDRTFPPSKKWREFAAAVEKMSEAERKDLIKQLQERLDAAP